MLCYLKNFREEELISYLNPTFCDVLKIFHLLKNVTMAIPNGKEAIKDTGIGDRPEIEIAVCAYNSLDYDDFEEFALNFEDYDLWEAIQNHLGCPGLEPIRKYCICARIHVYRYTTYVHPSTYLLSTSLRLIFFH